MGENAAHFQQTERAFRVECVQKQMVRDNALVTNVMLARC